MFEIVIVIFFFIFVFSFIIIMGITDYIRRINIMRYFKNTIVSKIDSNDTRKANVYNDVAKYKLDRLNIDDINLLKDYLYDIFYRFEMAYNNLDYAEMRLLSTKQLFEKYHTGITLNLKVGKKKVINDIKREKVVVYEVDSTTAKQIASAMICVSYITYTTNKEGNVISGNKIIPLTEKFEVEFRKEYVDEELTHCPNCGAKMDGNRCEYCETTVNNSDFKISAIRRIVES